ncbi:MAG: hypothetical protein ABEJ34_04805 [Haloferacaceae archaeon]
MSSNRGEGLDRLFRLLVAHRMLVYVGGLVVIGIPLFMVRAFGRELPWAVRTTLVVTSLTIMIVTYVGERRVGHDHLDDTTGESTEEYPLRMRLAVAMAVLGLAVGVFVALEVNVLGGLMFIGGSYFFAYVAYRDGDDGAGGVEA